MPQSTFSFDSFITNEIQGGHKHLTLHEKEAALGKGAQGDISGPVTWGNVDSFSSKSGDYQENLAEQRVYSQIEPPVLSTPPPQRLHQQPSVSNYSILDLLRNYTRGFKKSKVEKDNNLGNEANAGEWKLSTVEIMKMAGERYIHYTTQKFEHTMSMHPYGSSFFGISIEEMQDVELAHLLLAAAEKVGYQQFERASKLLVDCERLATDKGNPIQRIVYYFAEALRDRIYEETGRFISRRIEEKENYYIPKMSMSSNIVFLKFHQELPFNPVMVFTGIQAILEEVAFKTKIHLIDLQIRSGVQWTAFIQALSQRAAHPVQHLKITAVGTTDEQKMEETGKSLEAFAKSLKLPFSYKIIFLSDIRDLRNDHFHIAAHEAVVIYSQTILRSMISTPDCLDTLMRVIRSLKPSIMAMVEVEANHNSPSFFNRFTESLFFYTAYFDCLEDCTDREDLYRLILEGVFFRDGIRNIVAAEGSKRFVRNVKMDVWRAFFERYGMVGVGLSESSLFQANLHLKKFACASSCTLHYDEKCLILGWKGTPLHSLSTWMFC